MWPCSVYSPSHRRRPRLGQLARTSEPPCFSVMPMPASAPAFSVIGRRLGVVGASRPAAASTPWRSRRRPAAPGSPAYVIEIGQPCPGSVCDQAKKPAARRTCACADPDSQGAACEAVTDRALHQPVPRRVELDLVDAVAVAVVRRQLRVVPVGEPAVLAGLPGAGLGAERGQLLDDLGGGVAGDGLGQREVGGHHVVADQWRRLVRGYPDLEVHVDTVGRMSPTASRSLWERVRGKLWRAPRRHRRLVHPLPRHRAGGRGRLLRGALDAAADLRAGRCGRLRLRAVHRRPDRGRHRGDHRRRHRGRSPTAPSTGSSSRPSTTSSRAAAST